MNLKTFGLCFLLVFCSQTQILTEVDFILGSSYTGSYLWENFIGLSVDFANVQDLMNNSLYQGYQINSNIKGIWTNNFALSLKTPLGHKYNCSALDVNVTNPNTTCTFQTQSNATYWSVLGEYVWNTLNAPNWCIGYDMQGVNLTLTTHQDVFYSWLYQVYKSTYFFLFCNEIVDYGDKMVQRGYKTSYTPADFVKDIELANYVIFSIAHSGPGITEDAPKEWLLAVQDFWKVSWSGHYTVRCVVFKDPTQISIQKILSDNATKYYLLDRFRVNDTYAYNDFSNLWLGINDIRLTTGEGVDGVTNTFAAALWALDIVMEFILLNGWEIDFNHEVRVGNFQSILGPLPDLKPTPMYYGLMFAVLIRDGSPQVILPSSKGIISSKIKVFGFTTGQIFKVLLINKDTNASLNGTVLVKSELTGTLKCIYMEAPSLTAKDGITIAGYNFAGGNSSVNGTYTQKKLQYNYGAEGYMIPIKYAQAVLCETDDSIYQWPKGTAKSELKLWSSLSLVAFVFLMAFFL